MTSRPQRTEVLKLLQRVLGPIADAGQGGRRHEAPLRTDPFSGVFRKTAKKTSVILTNQRKHPLALLNNRLAKPPQVQLKLKLSSSWTQVELQSRRRRKPAEKSAEASGKVGGGRRKSRVGKRKSLRDEAWRVGGPGRSGLWRIAPWLVEISIRLVVLASQCTGLAGAQPDSCRLGSGATLREAIN